MVTRSGTANNVAAPHDPDAEAAVLAGILNHPSTAGRLLEIADPELFWVPRIKTAMRAVADLVADGISPEPVTVHTRLAGEEGDRFPLADLMSLTIDAPSDGGALECARVVARRGAGRAVVALSHELRVAVEQDQLDGALPKILDQLARLNDTPAGPGQAEHRGKIDWADFWSRDHSATDWLVEPFPRGGPLSRPNAPGKHGKSLFVLAVAVGLATGRPVLRQQGSEPIEVVYLDYEMTEDDIQERLGAMGYDETSDLAHFHYYLLPNLPPLDTAEGGRELAAIITADRASLVITATTAAPSRVKRIAPTPSETTTGTQASS